MNTFKYNIIFVALDNVLRIILSSLGFLYNIKIINMLIEISKHLLHDYKIYNKLVEPVASPQKVL